MDNKHIDDNNINNNDEFNLLDELYNPDKITHPEKNNSVNNNISEYNLDKSIHPEKDNSVHNNNISEYIIPEELKKNENGIVFLNVFMCYYKKLFNTQETKNMFYDVDYGNIKSTNRIMEFLYTEVYKYKKNQSDDELISLYNVNEINVSTCKELYALTIDGKYVKVCRFIVPIITYIAENYNWTTINWMIVPLK
jgi:hypothetical protein